MVAAARALADKAGGFKFLQPFYGVWVFAAEEQRRDMRRRHNPALEQPAQKRKVTGLKLEGVCLCCGHLMSVSKPARRRWRAR
jgi:hypothetical protein